MAKPRQFFYRLDAAHFLREVNRRREDPELSAWVRELALQLVTHDGDNDFARELIEEAERYSSARSQAGRAGNDARWGSDREAIAKRSQSDREAIAKVSPITEAEAEAEAGRGERGRELALAPRALKPAPGHLLELRIRTFGEALRQFSGEYPRELLASFFHYWTEPNRSGSKARWELERTWELGRRLKTWAAREQQPGRSSFRQQQQQQAEQNVAEILAWATGGSNGE